MDNESPNSESPLQELTFVAGGLVAICLIIMQAFISQTALDPAAFVALLSSTLALPILVGCIFVNKLEEQNKKRKPSTPRERSALNSVRKIMPKAPTDGAMTALFSVGVYLAFAGLIAVFWHISWIFGVVLLISTFIIGWFYVLYSTDRMVRMYQLDTSDSSTQASESTTEDHQD